jgi:hypothetical protein
MKTNVAPTSIAAFHDEAVQASIDTQRAKVARHIVAQTKSGKPSCIGSVWEHFCKLSDKALSQKSSVSRACNEIATECEAEGFIEVDGLKYEFQEVAAKKFNGHIAKHFCLVIFKTEAKALQTELF